MPGANVVCALKSAPDPFNFIVVVAPALSPVIDIVPSAAPLQLTLVALADTVTAIGCSIVAVFVRVKQLSITVNVYIPAGKLDTDAVAPAAWPEAFVQE